jgi:hypothetical protein
MLRTEHVGTVATADVQLLWQSFSFRFRILVYFSLRQFSILSVIPYLKFSCDTDRQNFVARVGNGRLCCQVSVVALLFGTGQPLWPSV